MILVSLGAWAVIVGEETVLSFSLLFFVRCREIKEENTPVNLLHTHTQDQYFQSGEGSSYLKGEIHTKKRLSLGGMTRKTTVLRAIKPLSSFDSRKWCQKWKRAMLHPAD